MSFCIQLDLNRQIVFSAFKGEISYNLVLEHMQALKENPDFSPHFNQLVNFSGVTTVLVTAEEVRLLAEKEVFSPRSRRAAVAPTELIFGMLRMFEAYRNLAGETNIMISRSLEEAMQWVQIEDVPAFMDARAIKV